MAKLLGVLGILLVLGISPVWGIGVDAEYRKSGNNYDDQCFWVGGSPPLVMVTSKSGNVVEVFNLETGAWVANIGGFNVPNNCAVTGNLLLTTESGGLVIHSLPGRTLVGRVSGLGDAQGVDVLDGAGVAYVTQKTGRVFEINLATRTVIRSWMSGFSSQEGIVVDDERGEVIIGNDDGGRVQVFGLHGGVLATYADHFGTDAEGGALVRCPSGGGGLVVWSDQSNNEFEVYDRVTRVWKGEFNLTSGSDLTDDTDGIDILQTPTSRWPHGVMAACDHCVPGTDNEVDLVDLEKILTLFGACGSTTTTPTTSPPPTSPTTTPTTNPTTPPSTCMCPCACTVTTTPTTPTTSPSTSPTTTPTTNPTPTTLPSDCSFGRRLTGPQSPLLASMPPNIDARGAVWSSTTNYPVRLDLSGTPACWFGGMVQGAYACNGSWDSYHNPNRAAVAIRGPNMKMEGVHLDAHGDGFRPEKGSNGFVLRGNWGSWIRDDFVENDGSSSGLTEDNLSESYVPFSCRNPNNPTDNHTGLWTIRNNLIHCQKQPGPTRESRNPGFGACVFKWQEGLCPRVAFDNNVVFADQQTDSEGGVGISDRVVLASCGGNRLLYGGTEPLNMAHLRNCFGGGVVTGQAARDEWAQRRAAWLAAHPMTGTPRCQ